MISNTTDATRGQSLRYRIEARRSELEAALEREDLSVRAQTDVQAALDSLALLTTAGLDEIPAMTAAQLSDWLEKHKYLAMTTTGRPRGKQPRSAPIAVPRELQEPETSGPMPVVVETSQPHHV
jgi:hypothetical protein